MMSPKKKKLSSILSAISIILLVIALFLGSSSVTVGTSMYSNVDTVKLEAQQFATDPEIVKGVVTKASFDDNTYVSYEYDGNTYETEQVIFTEECPVGTEVDVYVNPSAPTDVRVPGLFIPVYQSYGKALLIFGLCVSVGLTAVSVVLILINRGMKIKSKKLD